MAKIDVLIQKDTAAELQWFHVDRERRFLQTARNGIEQRLTKSSHRGITKTTRLLVLPEFAIVGLARGHLSPQKI
jgi:hypothetical protein